MIVISAIAMLILVSIPVISILAEWSFIKNRSKWEKIFPVIVTLLCSLLILYTAWGTYVSRGDISVYVTIGDEEDSLGSVELLHGRENNQMTVIGQMICGEGEDTEYVDLQFENGNLTGSEEALQYKEEIETALKPFRNEFTGQSVTYGEFEKKRDEQNNLRKRLFKAGNLLYGLKHYVYAPVIVWTMYLVSRWRRRRCNQAEKMKLEDL